MILEIKKKRKRRKRRDLVWLVLIEEERTLVRVDLVLVTRVGEEKKEEKSKENKIETEKNE